MSKSTRYILGLDVGNKGAVALLSLDGGALDWFKLPTRLDCEGMLTKSGAISKASHVCAKSLLEHLENFDILTCYIEKPMFSRFNYKLITNYGICIAILEVLEIPYVSYAPSSWMASLKSYIGFKDQKNVNKSFTFDAFKHCYPEIVLPAKEGGLDDDIADASLLAYLCYLNIEKERD
tara:strand:- start:387 stop:920 length:534 start_codon:yes stop_codon:yes gene_type:complete